MFRIGHLGDFNELSLMGTLSGVEMALELAGAVRRERDDLLLAGEAVEDRRRETGLGELGALVTAAAERAPGVVVADLRIARGLDYYTGTVYETTLDVLLTYLGTRKVISLIDRFDYIPLVSRVGVEPTPPPPPEPEPPPHVPPPGFDPAPPGGL